jgi:hypothetical protein
LQALRFEVAEHAHRDRTGGKHARADPQRLRRIRVLLGLARLVVRSHRTAQRREIDRELRGFTGGDVDVPNLGRVTIV